MSIEEKRKKNQWDSRICCGEMRISRWEGEGKILNKNENKWLLKKNEVFKRVNVSNDTKENNTIIQPFNFFISFSRFFKTFFLPWGYNMKWIWRNNKNNERKQSKTLTHVRDQVKPPSDITASDSLRFLHTNIHTHNHASLTWSKKTRTLG